jgi:ACS family tartrate transporter-like MFS transporter
VPPIGTPGRVGLRWVGFEPQPPAVRRKVTSGIGARRQGTSQAASTYSTPSAFAYYTVALAIVFWTPILVRDALHTSDSATANISGGIALLSALGYPLAGMLSDRWGERWGVAALGLVLGGAGCVGLAWLPNSMLCVLFLIVVGLCSALFMPAFWCLPTKVLKGPSAAAGIALVNAIGSSGGFFGPSIIGFLRNTTGSDSGGLFALAGLALVGGIVCLVLREVAVFRPDAAVPVTT